MADPKNPLNIGGSLVSGALDQMFSFFGAGRNWDYRKKEMELQQQYNERNMYLQSQYEKHLFDYQANYNSPVNSVARWRAAGIAPEAVYGSSPGGAGIGGFSGSISSSNPSAGGDYNGSGRSPVMHPADMLRLKNETKVADAQARKINAEAADQEWKNTLQPLFEREREALVSKIESEAAKSAVEAAWADYMAAMQAALAAGDLELKQKACKEFDARIDELKSRKVLNEADAEAARASARKMDAETQTENEARPYKIDSIIRENARKTSETALNWYRTRFLGPSEKERIDADTAEAKARARKVDAEIERLGKENDYTDAQIEYLKHLRKIGWYRFGLSLAKSISEEARGWFKEGSKVGAASGWAVDDEALGAIAATL